MSSVLEIIIPLRNPGAELASTIASLTSQTDRDFRVLLCDNYSTTGIEPIMAAQKQLVAAGIAIHCVKPPFELRRIEHWNWAHAESRGEWLKPLLPGGTLKPTYVQQFKQRISRQPKAQLVRCEFEIESARTDSRDDAPFPSAQPSLDPLEFLQYFPARMEWLAASVNMAYRRTAWLAAGGYCPQLPGCASLNLNVTLALHHGLENLPETLAAMPLVRPFFLNDGDRARVNLPLELWLVLRQARNYCLAAKLPWAKKWLLPAGIIAAMGRRRRHIYGR
jgi:hypothetical protein